MGRRHKNNRATLASLLVLAWLVVVAGSLGGCASVPTDPAARAAYDAANDPFEPLNRATFEMNMVFDRFLWEPLAIAYTEGTPELVQVWMRNFLSWLREPTVLMNNLLQGDIQTAGKTTARFMINTLLGPAGLRDMAKQQGFTKQTGDFGQTLHVWGFPEGPYIVIPVLGPSNLRDGIGLGVDSIADPIRFAAISRSQVITWGRFGIEGIDERAQNLDAFDEIRKNSVDFYAQLRSIIRQRRAVQLHMPPPGVGATPASDDLYADPAAQK
jgi:phospholipid-binding lipoprotein MlaA